MNDYKLRFEPIIDKVLEETIKELAEFYCLPNYRKRRELHELVIKGHMISLAKQTAIEAAEIIKEGFPHGLPSDGERVPTTES